ncbi:VOC family protein [Microbispora triticiradicis]|uniref:VOC family protein n=1 Tax=Microbispora triticiradicis TaxID=2200763 RepID=UPI001AD678ED|nr:VOC family protein [Microbispora triticiradicis]MBO4274536.1 hypothetical protein [Microbispora triticiradicis]
MAFIKDIVFDSPHPASAARFWAQVLDGYEIAPYDEEELARLRALGATVQAEREDWITMQDPDGNEFCPMRS